MVARRNDGERRTRHACARVRDVDRDHPMDLDGLPPRTRDGDSAQRLGSGAVRCSSDLDRVDHALCRWIGSVRNRVVCRQHHRVPRRAGSGRRTDGAGDADDPHAGGGGRASASSNGGARRSRDARTRFRPCARRSARQQCKLAADLLHQCADLRRGAVRGDARRHAGDPSRLRIGARRARTRSTLTRHYCGGVRPRASGHARVIR
jgi:hypothetical protein